MMFKNFLDNVTCYIIIPSLKKIFVSCITIPIIQNICLQMKKSMQEVLMAFFSWV